MSHARANRLFAGLMIAAFLCAFIVPSRFIDPVRRNVAGIFVPVSAPMRWIGASVSNRFKHEEHGPADVLADENTALRDENAGLRDLDLAQQRQIEQLAQLAAERERLGDLSRLCTRVDVANADPSGLDSLILVGSSLSGLANDEPALYDGGIAGRIIVGWGGARLRLISDTGVNVTGRFVRFVKDANGKTSVFNLPTPPPLIEGAGHGALVIRKLRSSDVSDVRIGDMVELDDRDWASVVQGRFIGMVSEIRRPERDFATIRVEPARRLLGLTYVEVLTGQ